MNKKLIKSFDIKEVEDYFLEINDKKFRARQLFNWLYERNVATFDEMTNFTKDLRRHLSEKFILSPLEIEDVKKSKVDGTEKFLFKTLDGHYIESVLIKSDGTDSGRLTICISSQIGCAMGCTFCETGRLGFIRNLEVGEILDQINQVRRYTNLKNNNIVFMGMGEPFNNYDKVLKACDIMNYSFGFHFSTRKITLSTCGILDKIERFIDERRPYNLALSLNDTESHKRKLNMPVENKYPFEKIADLLRKKFPKSGNRLTVEYVMRKDNILSDDAKRLKKMFRYSKIKLNLIPLNSGRHSLDEPTQEEIDNFLKELEIMNVPVSIRKSAGSDISGACGQLAGKKYLGED